MSLRGLRGGRVVESRGNLVATSEYALATRLPRRYAPRNDIA
jgi:hypothetical protein